MARRRKRSQPRQTTAPGPLSLSPLREFIGLPGLTAIAWACAWVFTTKSPSPQLESLIALAPTVTTALLVLLAALGILLRQGRTLLLAIVACFLATRVQTAEYLQAAAPLVLATIVCLAPRHPFRRRNVLSLTLLGIAGWSTISPATSTLRAQVEQLGARIPAIGLPATGFALSALLLTALLIRQPTSLARGGLWSLPFLYLSFDTTPLGAWAPAALPAAMSLWIVAALGEAHASSFRDALTRLPGRRAFDRELAELGRRYSIAMVDIDHFKRVNDRHGHDVGDQVLAKVASLLGRVRGGRAFRYGGEEFAIVFRGRGPEECGERLDGLRGRIASAPFGVRGSKQRLKVTVSIGVAERNSKRPNGEEVLAAADKALYRAKRAGRNRVQAAG